MMIASACSQGNVFSLAVGDCFNSTDSTAEEISDVPMVDCGESHDFEVFYLFDLPDGDYPGEAAAFDAMGDGCLAQFEAYVGQTYELSALGSDGLYPTQGSWDAGDREIACLLYDFAGGTLTGSHKGSGA